ncbi:polymorphic toxin-type HINT domain-containing protein [Kribbella yunnanensis]
MRYAGFSDEVVTDGTQSFGRSASDGLLSIGYETTKRLVLSDRHGDAIAGFDPTDTTLSAGLPDTRTFDPFGNSTNATGLKYRIGYQGDWTDPRSGDVNQGARWYDPGTGTFNARDTISHPAGAASSVRNLYGYGSGNPVTLNDPDGHRAVDPESGGKNCKLVLDPNGEDDALVLRCNPNLGGGGKGNPPPVIEHICLDCWGEPIPPTDTGCKKHCGGDEPKPRNTCKPNCGHKPPPVCDAQCRLQKAVVQERDRLEVEGKTKPKPPPGNPVCANGNAALCQYDPQKPGTVVGPQGNLTDETSDYASQVYTTTLKQVGSVVGQAAKPPKQSWLEDAFDYGLPGSHFNGMDQGMLDFYNAHPELVHLGMDVLGMLPIVGSYYDGMNATLYGTEGDKVNAGLSGAAAIPGIGDAATGAKLGGRALKLLDKLAKSCKVNSFAPDTRVLMADGSTKRIDKIHLGDQVLSTDPETGQSSPQPVTALITGTGDKDLIDLTVETKAAVELPETSRLVTTAGHPFYLSASRAWVEAGDLKAGDQLTSGPSKAVPSNTSTVISARARTERATVHNLTVHGHHTYYVLAGAAPVLVHNSSVCGFKNPVSADEIEAANRAFGGSHSQSGGTPQNALINAGRYEGFHRKAASLIRNIAGDHMYDNGNKRTAHWVVTELMSRNGIVSGPTSDELWAVISRVSKPGGTSMDIDDIAKLLRGY